jgi:ADP-ribose pyrophosphatase YjhB (NUDIX family)
MTFTDRASWFASLPSLYGSAAALLVSREGDILVVKPNYRPLWSLPGGILEDNEPPHIGCAREVREEIGLSVDIGRLLVVDWIAADGDRPRPTVAFLFDGGVLADGPGEIVLQESELDDWRFIAADELGNWLPPRLASRVAAGLRARSAGGGAVYLTAEP